MRLPAEVVQAFAAVYPAVPLLRGEVCQKTLDFF